MNARPPSSQSVAPAEESKDASAPEHDFQALPGLEASLALIARLSSELAKAPAPYRRTLNTEVTSASNTAPLTPPWPPEAIPPAQHSPNGAAPFNHDFFNQAFLQKAVEATHPLVTKAKTYPRSLALIVVAIIFGFGFGAGYVTRVLGFHITVPISEIAAIEDGKLAFPLSEPQAINSDTTAAAITKPPGMESESESVNNPGDFDIKLPAENTQPPPATTAPVASADVSPSSTPNLITNVPRDTTQDSATSTMPKEETTETTGDGDSDGSVTTATNTTTSNEAMAASSTPVDPVHDATAAPTTSPQIPVVPAPPPVDADLAALRVRFHKNPTDDGARTDFANALAQADAGGTNVTEELQSLASNRPKLAPVQAALGRLFARHGDTTNAALYFNRAIHLDDMNTLYRFDLATVYDRAGNGKMALSLYRQVLRMEAGTDSTSRSLLPLSSIQNRAQYLASQNNE